MLHRELASSNTKLEGEVHGLWADHGMSEIGVVVFVKRLICTNIGSAELILAI